METSLYIRIRGRVLGPYDQEKLQSLARRGQLSRMHELSADGASWIRAANYPELFVGAATELAAQRESAAASTAIATDSAGQVLQLKPLPQWYYSSGGTQRGPIDFTNLQMLFGMNQIGPDDLVWSEGMSAWMPASQVPGLVKNAGNQATSTPEKSDALPLMLCRSFTGSRPWIMFIIVAVIIYALLAAAKGLFLLVAGGRSHNPVLVAWGIFALISALDLSLGAYLLGSYHSRLGNLLYNHSKATLLLEKAQSRLMAVWIYAAINLIIMLVFLGIAVVFALAAGATLPW